MRASRITSSGLIASVVCILVAWLVSARSEEAVSEKLGAGERLPLPPMQRTAWTPPATELPEALITATKTLFELGLGDPRGCEYRKIALAKGVGTMHRGWVIPSAGNTARRFAVCWDGLVYPVFQVGDRANFRAELQSGIKKDKDVIAEDKDGFFDESRTYPNNNADEGAGISHETIVPVKVCLLLRLGEGELARDVWQAWTNRLLPGGNGPEFMEKPFLVLAANWSRDAFGRALSAHIEGDDRLALIAIHEYVPIEEGVRAQALILGVQRYRPPSETEQLGRDRGGELPGMLPDGQVPVHLQPDDLFRDLLADQERRARESAMTRPAVADRDRAGRIAALIHDLENINNSLWAIPGHPDFSRIATYQMLVAEGDEAVLPLLDVVEHDDRLTRTFMTGRGMRFIVRVHEAAYAALRAILGTDEFGMDLEYDHKVRQQAAARMRAYWERNGKIPIELRWYRRMADDGAPHDQWLEAAARIVAPAEPTARAGMTEVSRLRGEPLRNNKDANVSALMARRVESMDPSRGTRDTAELHKAVRMARYLARWDRAAAVPVLRALSAMCLAPRSKFPQAEAPLRAYAELVALRVHCGDVSALDEYAAWLRVQPLSTLEASGSVLFEPLWRFADHPSMRGLAASLFSDPKSPWAPGVLTEPGIIEKLVTSPLLGVAAFRGAVMKCLSNTSILGEVTPGPRVKNVEVGSSVHIRDSMMVVTLGTTERSERYDGEDLLAKPGVKSAFRVCDYYAWRLGCRACALYWPEKNRDDAVSATRTFLARYGAGFKPLDAGDRPEPGPYDFAAILCFPVLDHPATPAEVERGLAIFSLGPGTEARVVPLPNRPLLARWNGSARPAVYPSFGFGMVWQAEEVRENGKLRRYYGFVGDNILARVPAEELEFFPEAGQPIIQAYP